MNKNDIIFTSEPIDMIYGDENLHNTNSCKTLASGSYKGYDFVIVNTLGNHPCGYISVPDVHGLDEYAYDFFPHGGITFTAFQALRIGLHEKEGYVWLGWDFNHLGDYSPYSDGHKWTTQEIIDDMKEAVDDYIKGGN